MKIALAEGWGTDGRDSLPVELTVGRDSFGLIRDCLADAAIRQPGLYEEPTARAVVALNRAEERRFCWQVVMRAMPEVLGELVQRVQSELPDDYPVRTERHSSYPEFIDASRSDARTYRRYVDLTPKPPTPMPDDAVMITLDSYSQAIEERQEFYALPYERGRLRPPRQRGPGLYGQDARPTVSVPPHPEYI